MAWTLNSDKPLYTQLVEIIQTQIVSGIYKAGDRLPSVRDLAAQASVNPNTMQKAFAELERYGLIITQRTSGRTVTEDHDLLMKIRLKLANEYILEFFHTMQQLGYTQEEIVQLIKQTAAEES